MREYTVLWGSIGGGGSYRTEEAVERIRLAGGVRESYKGISCGVGVLQGRGDPVGLFGMPWQDLEGFRSGVDV